MCPRFSQDRASARWRYPSCSIPFSHRATLSPAVGRHEAPPPSLEGGQGCPHAALPGGTEDALHSCTQKRREKESSLEPAKLPTRLPRGQPRAAGRDLPGLAGAPAAAATGVAAGTGCFSFGSWQELTGELRGRRWILLASLRRAAPLLCACAFGLLVRLG